MGGRRVPAERVERLLGCLELGLNPVRAAAVAGVSKSFAYVADRERRGGAGRLAARRAGMAAREQARAGRERERAGRERRVLGLLGSGLNPGRAAAAAGVSKTYAYDLRPGWAVCAGLLERLTVTVTSAVTSGTRSPGSAARSPRWASGRSRRGSGAPRRR